MQQVPNDGTVVIQPPDHRPIDWGKVKTLKDMKAILSRLPITIVVNDPNNADLVKYAQQD